MSRRRQPNGAGFDKAIEAVRARKEKDTLAKRLRQSQSTVATWMYFSKGSGKPILVGAEVADQLSRLLGEAAEVLEFHPRAAKLMCKRKPFVVVAYDEKYFADVYKTIRLHEIEAGRWTDEDQKEFLRAIHPMHELPFV